MSEKKRYLTAGILAFAGVFLMITGGVFGGEAAIVLRKAIYICLECIGIG